MPHIYWYICTQLHRIWMRACVCTWVCTMYMCATIFSWRKTEWERTEKERWKEIEDANKLWISHTFNIFEPDRASSTEKYWLSTIHTWKEFTDWTKQSKFSIDARARTTYAYSTVYIVCSVITICAMKSCIGEKKLSPMQSSNRVIQVPFGIVPIKWVNKQMYTHTHK